MQTKSASFIFSISAITVVGVELKATALLPTEGNFTEDELGQIMAVDCDVEVASILNIHIYMGSSMGILIFIIA